MEMNPQRVRSAEFKTVRKGVDPEEVSAFLGDVADELERAQNQSTAMEARARAAVARLQELSEAAAAPAAAPDASVEESETISRTLLLAQRTADATVAEARADAARIISEANEQAAKTIDSTREMSAGLLDEARTEARRIGEAERLSVASEVEALKARRDFLEADVHHLETFLVDQRSRVREAASSLIEIADRVPGGLGAVRSPLLSASDDDSNDDLDGVDAGDERFGDDEVLAGGSIVDQPEEILIVTEIAVDDDSDDEESSTVDESTGGDESSSGGEDPWATGGDPTEAIPVVRLDDDGEPGPTPNPGGFGDEFRFSFDDERS